MPAPEHLLISDIDGTLTGDDDALKKLMERLGANGDRIGFGVASGRSLALIWGAVDEFLLLEPNPIIAGVGSEIHGDAAIADAYRNHINEGWDRERCEAVLAKVDGLTLQEAAAQTEVKLSFTVQEDVMPRVQEAVASAGLELTLIHSHNKFLDVLPKRASKGQAVRFVSKHHDIPLDRIIVAGDTGNDADMLTCGANAIVVGNYAPELKPLLNHEAVYLAKEHHAAGVLEGLSYFGVLEGNQSSIA